MDIKKVVERALQDGFLTPAMETEIGSICENASELSLEEYMALEQLMNALLDGTVVTTQHKRFINVMEELVLSEALALAAEIETTSDRILDLGDVTAYALNRLPPLYATTEEGASFQKQKAAEGELQALIRLRVREAIAHHLNRPILGDRQALRNAGGEVVGLLATLLQDLASVYEQGER